MEGDKPERIWPRSDYSSVDFENHLQRVVTEMALQLESGNVYGKTGFLKREYVVLVLKMANQLGYS